MSPKFPVRPSGMGSAVYCPTNAIAPLIVETEGSKYAIQGTAIHVAIDIAYNHGLETIGLITDNAEDVLNITKAVGILKDIGGDEVKTEYYVESEDIGGTIDGYFYDGVNLHLFDYKNGYKNVEARENYQLLSYAYAISQKINFESLFVYIYQPNVLNGGLKTASYKKNDLMKYFKVIKNTITAVKAEVARLNKIKKPTKTQLFKNAIPNNGCIFCNLAGYCDKNVNIKRIKKMEKEFIKNPSEWLKKLTDADFNYLLGNGSTIKNMVDKVSTTAHQKLSDGGSIKGFKLVTAFGNRKINQPLEVVVERFKEQDIPRNLVVKTSKESLQTLKVLDSLNKKVVADITSKEEKLIIVPENDIRVKARTALDLLSII